MARAHVVLLVALAASALAFAAAQQPQYYDPQQQVQAATTQTQRPSQPETEPNLFENLWNIAHKTVGHVADQASETDNVNTDSAVVNADSANVLNVLMDAVGGVGDFITG